MPDASQPSRFLEEVPAHLLDDLGSPRPSRAIAYPKAEADSHYSYEDEDQSVEERYAEARKKQRSGGYSGPKYNSRAHIDEVFASRGKKFRVPRVQSAAEKEKPAKGGFRPGQRVRHPKYGEGVVYQREGDGETAKVTVQFPRFGLKKLVEKYAQLER